MVRPRSSVADAAPGDAAPGWLARAAADTVVSAAKPTAVTKAVILAGGDSASLGPLTDVRPKPLLPVLNRPLIEWQLEALLRNGIEEVGIALSPDDLETVSCYLKTRFGKQIQLRFATDEVPRGPAGGIKLFEDLLAGETFLVLDGGTFLGDVRIDKLVRAHRERGATATMGIVAPTEAPNTAEAVVAADGTITSIFELHHSSNRRRSRTLTGLNVFDSSVLELIPDRGHFDVKERLLGKLQAQGAVVLAETARGLCVPIDSMERYYQLQVELLEGDFEAADGYRQLADGIWIGEDSELSTMAHVVGPVLIGRDCTIEEGAELVGPVVLGDGCRVGARSVVRGSILWERSQLAPGCKVETSLVAGVSVREEAWLRRSISVVSRAGTDETRRLLPQPISPVAGAIAHRVPWHTAAGKALIDFVGAALLLLVLSPIMLLCAVAIRVSSRGPVFFSQRRCGRRGKPFRMLKFRTMVEDASERQAELRAKNETDGPVFKIFADPRITTVGKVLRRTSLDELPQLLNVLRGEMSLVGPRPLAADEMRYCSAWRDRRLSVKPGMTGLWQVNGRSRANFHDWIRYDIAYVRRLSLGLDLRILAKTVAAVVRRSGAC